MSKLIMTKGLPGSGKSTWAYEQVESNPSIVHVNKDYLRAMLYGDAGRQNWHEKLTIQIRDSVVQAGLMCGKDVIVDDTNFNPIHEKTLRIIASEYDAEFKVKDFTGVPLDECLKRDRKRHESVGDRIIRDMHNQYIRPTLMVEQDINLPFAVISDLDGTLALLNGRDAYDATDCEYDNLNEPVWNAIMKYLKDDYKLIITSGRSSKYLPQTDRWLGKHGIYPDMFLMRKEGDSRKDYDLKREMYLQNIHKNYYVEAVFDDRNRVVDAYRDLGLTVFQVADGYF